MLHSFSLRQQLQTARQGWYETSLNFQYHFPVFRFLLINLLILHSCILISFDHRYHLAVWLKNMVSMTSNSLQKLFVI